MKNQPLPAWVENLSKAHARKLLGPAQVALYVMVGGGFLGQSYATDPKNAYTDTRARRLPYSARQVNTARVILCRMAEKAGFDPANLPPMPDLVSMGVF